MRRSGIDPRCAPRRFGQKLLVCVPRHCRLQPVELRAASAREFEAANTIIATLQEERKTAEIRQQIADLVEETKLPKLSKEHLLSLLEGETDVDRAKSVVSTHVDYIQKLNESGNVRNMGGDASATSGGSGKVDLTESFMKLGLSKEEAELAAKGGSR